MRAILTFRLPQEQEEFDDASHGGEWHCVMRELDEFLRQDLKYCAGRKMSEDIRTKLHEILDGRGLLLFN